MITPEQIALIGEEVAVRWSNGREDYFPMGFLRRHSPSAENIGEKDVTGRLLPGARPSDGRGVRVNGWNIVGGYAVQFIFSDGHSTGLYSFEYLLRLSDMLTDSREGA